MKKERLCRWWMSRCEPIESMICENDIRSEVRSRKGCGKEAESEEN